MSERSDVEIAMMAALDDLVEFDLVAVANGLMIRVHDVSACVGRAGACWVHRPSPWPLAAAPVVWDNASGRAFRRCEHGVLHRDLDDYEFQSRYATRYAGMPLWCCPDERDCGCCRREDVDE